eukprot:CAMPEP_0179076582 /NCGR_PEP_ID=MMETSP0796-20121207/34175_1 /TAXON_ID=73915 /ORGANISM="Pyrodinium bahamense, Strain pbaha01" /LENGTH=95 /DNA_ID=CAMNT_0020773839 /DNA_START=13 /DNA_END=300 /DNA_ORIENTATION=-
MGCTARGELQGSGGRGKASQAAIAHGKRWAAIGQQQDRAGPGMPRRRSTSCRKQQQPATGCSGVPTGHTPGQLHLPAGAHQVNQDASIAGFPPSG